MTPRLLFLLSLFLGTLGHVPICSAQEVTVLALDVRTGNPLANETVSMQFHIAQVPELQELEVKTRADGKAQFHLPTPIPSKISVYLPNRRLYPCSVLSGVDTQQVIADGLVSRCSKPTQGCRCKFGKWITQFRTTPGELVLLARPVTSWERFLWHIWE